MSFHDELIAKVIPISVMEFVTGTWTKAVATNIWTNDKTATDEASTIRIPISMPFHADKAYKGCALLSVSVYFSVATAAMDALAAVLYEADVAVDGSAMTAATVTTTYDAGHDDAAERIDIDDHLLTLTVTTPEWADDGKMYWMEIVADAAATSVFKVGDAIAKFKARM